MNATQLTSSSESAAGTADREVPARQRVLLMTVARGEERFCVRLGDVSEVGRVGKIARMSSPHNAVLGSMVLHGETIPVVDAALAIGAACQFDDNPKMFAATRTQPGVCIGFDKIVGKHEEGEKNTGKHPHELIRGLVAKGGRSLPVIDVQAVAQLTQGAAPVPKEADTARES